MSTPICTSPSGCVPTAIDLDRQVLTQTSDRQNNITANWSRMPSIVRFDLLEWMKCAWGEGGESPLASACTHLQFIWAIKQNQTLQKHAHAHQTVATDSCRAFYTSYDIYIYRDGWPRLYRSQVVLPELALTADFSFCRFECEFLPKSGQLQWDISWLAIIFVGHLMALRDGPRAKLSNKAS